MTGRDPRARPLKIWEWQLFRRALETHWTRENKPAEEQGAVPDLPANFYGGDEEQRGGPPQLPPAARARTGE